MVKMRSVEKEAAERDEIKKKIYWLDDVLFIQSAT